MELELEGKKALITGGSHGIGAAIGIGLAEEGVSVSFLSRSQERLRQQDKLLQERGVSTLPLQCDVLNPLAIEHSWQILKESWGGVDILINNVGGGGRWGTEKIIDTPISTWAEVYQKNAGVASQLTMLALPRMLEKRWGRVVTITSIFGNTVGGRPWFNMAKVSQSILMKNLAQNKRFAGAGITFNSVAPGAVMIPDTGWTEMEKNEPEEFKKFRNSLPRGQFGTPDEVSNLVVFLCSTKASYINGASILIDGGESPSPY
jgi:3-oxoacyl-[acyl-carrier protein] reductase